VLAYVGTAGDQQAILETVGEARTVFAPNPQTLIRRRLLNGARLLTDAAGQQLTTASVAGRQ
jgi:hypothetical protein